MLRVGDWLAIKPEGVLSTVPKKNFEFVDPEWKASPTPTAPVTQAQNVYSFGMLTYLIVFGEPLLFSESAEEDMAGGFGQREGRAGFICIFPGPHAGQ